MADVLLFFLALVPIVGLILALGVFQVPAHWATPAAWVVTGVLALVFWQLDPHRWLGATVEGVAFALWPIMLVIIAAIFTYHLAEETGSLKTIETMLTGITTDKRIQVLILAWGFGGFLEAVAGYGTAVAIPASILALLGFNPVFAAVISLIANTVPTAFGAVGIPVSTLAALTGLEASKLSLAVALQLTPFIILVPFVLVFLTGGGFKALKGVVGITLVAGVSFAIPQLLAAAFLGPELPALLGSIVALVSTIAWAKVFHHESAAPGGPRISWRQGVLAWLPYLLILAVILLASKLVPPVYGFLGQFKSSVVFWEGGKPVDFKWVATPGVLILFAAFVGAQIQGAKFSQIARTFGKTLWKLRKSTLTVVSILAMAKVMDASGMISNLAQVLVAVTGGLYPLVAPMIGALGTFVTGSDTSSNVLFGKLQLTVAGQTGLDPYWLAAANTAGATAGKMISPQSIAVATGATGLTGQEGKILQQTFLFCLGYVLLLGVLVLVVSLAPSA
ncbi:MAG: L-lactate permease [Spirochaetales bacterium]